MAYGMLGHVAIGFQSSFGTALTSSMDFFPFESESLSDEIERLSAAGMRNRFDEGDHYEGAHNPAGDVVMELHPLLVGKLLKAWNGGDAPTLVGSVWTHLGVPTQADWDAKAATPPMTIEVHRDVGSSFILSDMLLNAITIEIANGTISKSTASFIGGNFAWGQKNTPSYPQGSYFTWDVSSISLAGAATDLMSQITLTLTQGLEAKHTLNGTKYPSRIKRAGYRSIAVAGTMLFEDDVEARVFRAQTLQRLLITLTGEALTTSQSNLLLIDVPKMVYEAFPVNIGGPGLIEVGFTGIGKYDTTSSYSVQTTLVNTQAAY